MDTNNYNSYKTIAIRHRTYAALKENGRMGESFDDVISSLLNKQEVSE
ncbi:MAG TPA: antitoxin VapB family protein [Nitrososphaera sp.]|nr:antitoxin VapB family protein [Nitrososphaera sp.]